MYNFWDRYALSLYMVIALLTFGIAASRNEQWNDSQRAVCLYAQKHAVDGQPVPTCYNADMFPPPLAGIAAGLLWPFYWTWEAVDAVRGVK